jgi:hypothetical protein
MTIDYDEAYVNSEVEHAKQVAKETIVRFLEADVYDENDTVIVLCAMRFLESVGQNTMTFT